MKKILRPLCLLLASVIAFSLCSCTGGNETSSEASEGSKIELTGDHVLKYGDRTIDEYDYMYIASYMRDRMVASQQSYIYQLTGQIVDEATILSLPYEDGRTLADFVSDYTLELARQMLIIETLCDEAGVTITDSDALAKIDERISDLEYAYGGSDLFDVALAKMGFTRDSVVRFERFAELYDLLREHRYGKEGSARIAESTVKDYFRENYLKFDGVCFAYTEVVDGKTVNITNNYSDEEIEQYFRDNYVNIAHILYSTLDDSRNPLPDDEAAKVEEKAKAAYDAVVSGEKQHADFKSETADGSYSYVFTKGRMVSEFEEAAFDMEVGDVRLVKTQYGYHLMLKLELTDEDLYGEGGREAETESATHKEVVAAMTARDIKALGEKLLSELKSGEVAPFPETYGGFAGYTKKEVSLLDKTDSNYSSTSETVGKIAEGDYGTADVSEGFYVIRRLKPEDSDITDSVYAEIEDKFVVEAYLEYVNGFIDLVEVNKTSVEKFDPNTLSPLEEAFYQ